MKVFVYSKKSSKKIAIIKDVVNVNTESAGIITFTTATGEKISFNTFTIKTTIYQN